MLVIVSRARWVEIVNVLILEHEELGFVIYEGWINLQKAAGRTR